MYAIVNIHGHQYRVAEQDRIKVSLIDGETGQNIIFNQVLLLDDDKQIKIGAPFVKDVTISADILEHGRDRKIMVYKKKRRKGYQRKNGHRQDYTMIQINKIRLGTTKKTAAKPAAAKTTKVSETGKA